MKDKQLRQQLVDCLLYYKKLHDCWYERPYSLNSVEDWNTNMNGDLTIQGLLNLVKDKGFSLSDLILDGCSYTDGDFEDHYVQISVREPSTDKEWFDEIADALSPRWHYDRYKQYLGLEKEFK